MSEIGRVFAFHDFVSKTWVKQALKELDDVKWALFPGADSRLIRIASEFPSVFAIKKGTESFFMQADTNMLNCEKEILMMGNTILASLKRNLLSSIGLKYIPVLDQIQWTMDKVIKGGYHKHNDSSYLVHYKDKNKLFGKEEMIVITFVIASDDAPAVDVQWFSNTSSNKVGSLRTGDNTFHIQGPWIQSDCVHKVCGQTQASSESWRISCSMRQAGHMQTSIQNIRRHMKEHYGLIKNGELQPVPSDRVYSVADNYTITNVITKYRTDGALGIEAEDINDEDADSSEEELSSIDNKSDKLKKNN